MNLNAPQRSSGLIVENVRKSYGTNVILDDLSIDVERGKLVSLLGPSGCGKTTTLNMIAGFDAPDSGQILIDGQDVTGVASNQRDTAIVFQNYALFPHMTVLKNVSYGLRVRKLDKSSIGKRVDRVMGFLGIDHLRDRYPGALSGGQQQRVSLARALAVQPSVLLLDEPLSNLDSKLRQKVRTEIRRLQQDLEQTAVFVTHDQDEALAISDYIAVLNGGVLEQYGPPAELWEQPRTVFVADFMGVENILSLDHAAGDVRTGTGSASVSERIPDSIGASYTHLGFRPSDARLTAADGDATRGLAVPVTVRQRYYMGTHISYACVLADGEEELTVDQPAQERQWERGSRCLITVGPNGLLPLHDTIGSAERAS